MTEPPRTRLATLPTPLVPAHRLSRLLGVQVWLKRDDLTGLGLGGNKARQLEFIIGHAESVGANALVTGGGPRSNWVMLAALAAVNRGMSAEVALFGDPRPAQGNLELLQRIPGVCVQFTGDPDRASVDPMLQRISARLEGEGRKPHIVGRGGAGPHGALGYVWAVDEMNVQMEALGLEAPTIWVPTGSCGTQAGLVAGHRLPVGPTRRVVGVSVHRPVDECRLRIEDFAAGALELLGQRPLRDTVWEVLGDRLTPRRREADAAAAMVAATEGVFLDPEFGAPAMAELISRAPRIDGPVVFVVTGGAPNLFVGNP